MSAPPVLRLATDIGAQFQHVPQDEAAQRIADHIRLFWEPRMTAQLRELVAAAGPDCDPAVARAVELLDGH